MRLYRVTGRNLFNWTLSNTLSDIKASVIYLFLRAEKIEKKLFFKVSNNKMNLFKAKKTLILMRPTALSVFGSAHEGFGCESSR